MEKIQGNVCFDVLFLVLPALALRLTPILITCTMDKGAGFSYTFFNDKLLHSRSQQSLGIVSTVS